MAVINPNLTRRQLLRSAGIGAAGLTVAGTLGEIASVAFASPGPGPPRPPQWHTRPDLQIPALTVTRREQGVSSDPIFIAPYNAPVGQVGAVIVDNEGQPIWENPLAGKVTTNFQVQSYRGSPVLTWWEGLIEYGHGVGEYVIADAELPHGSARAGGGGLRGDLHEFVITPRDTALLTSYVIRKADLRAAGGPREGTIQDAIFQEVDLATGRLLLEWHSLDHVPLTESYAPVEANWDFFHINSVDLDGDGNLLISSRSMQTVYKLDHSGKILWRLGGKSNDFEIGPGRQLRLAARRPPPARRDAHDLRQRRDPGGGEALPRPDPRARRAGDDRQPAASVHAPEDPLRQPGQHAAAGNGNVFVGWGEVPHVSEFDYSGRMLFDAVLGEKYQSYRAFRLPWTGLPARRPRSPWPSTAANEPSMRAGTGRPVSSAGSCSPVSRPATCSRCRVRGRADSRARCPRPPRPGLYLAVQALDAGGAPLGRSNTVTA